MAVEPDPYRTLGLKRGATLDDVKRAYRRLAKINHPDAAGEAALPRFLAIQAAYEQLAEPAPGTGRRPTPAPRRPWDAEADKTRRAYGGRARNAPPGAAGTGGAGATGKGGAAGTGGEAGGSAAPGEGSGGWTRRGGSAGRTGGTSGRPGRRRTYEPRPDSGTPGTPPPGGKTRAPNKATLGSTSYDGADASLRARLGWRQLVRHNQRHVLDGEPEGIRRSPQARAGVPGTRPAGGPSARRGSVHARPRCRGASGRTRRSRRTGDPATAGRPAGPTHTTSSWWDSTAGPAG